MRTRAALKAKTKSVSSKRPTATSAPKRPLRTALLGIVATGAAFAYMPPTTYRSEAVIGVGSSTTPLREAMTEAAVATAVSKPVMSRAASSLIGTQLSAPEPGLLDKILVTVGWGRARASDARLAETLTSQVTARSGDVPGVIKISAASSQASAAAKVATTVAEALIDEQDVQAVDARQRREANAAKTIEGLKVNAANAHRQLVALGGGSEVDPAQARAAAASQTAAAQGRLDVVRGILASGTPPLSDRHDLPQNAATLQAAYLDLSQQLSKARETLGDKHTTVISLQQGVKAAATNLTAEWKRLNKVAEADVDAARDRETSLSKSIAPANPKKRAALDDARRNVAIADEALARAQKAGAEAPVDDNPYRLVAPAPIPSQATGFSLHWRLALSLLAGLIAIFVARLQPRVASLWTASVSRLAAPASPVVAPVQPSFFARDEFGFDDRSARPAERTEPALAMPSTARRPTAAPASDFPPDLDDLIPALDAIEPQGTHRLVLVGSNEEGEATSSLALALSEAAAAEGHRVLLIEAQSTEGALAASADADANPILIDIFGQLRVAMPADIDEGFLFVAPGLRNGDRIAQRLARSGEVVMLDDISDEFDLVIVDGGQVEQTIDLIPPADAFLRVGRHPSKRDDQRFLATCGASSEEFLGTITSSAFIAREEAPVRRPAPAARSVERSNLVSRTPRSTGTVIELPVRRRVASR